MKKIVFIIPYFGHFNNYFDIWLNSCANNPTIDWLIFTDCRDKYNFPQNVKVIYTTFEEIKAHFQSFYDFKISLEKPYKLCDFKPAYGEIFYEYIKDYDFWGYCDIDLIWGNMRNFLTDDLLSKYEKIGNMGHCCLIKNTEKLRKIYRYEDSDFVTYKEAFSSNLAYCFDEKDAFGKYCKNSGILSCDNYTFFDLSYRFDDYRITIYEESIFLPNAHNIFEYDNGKLFLWYVKIGENEAIKKEISYVHLQKRPFTIDINKDSYNHFLIFKDKISNPVQVNSQLVKKLDKKKWKRTLYYKLIWNKIKVELFNCEGVKYYKYKK